MSDTRHGLQGYTFLNGRLYLPEEWYAPISSTLCARFAVPPFPPAILNGTPHASLALTDQVPVALTLTAAEADVAQIAKCLQQTVGIGSSAHQRLNADPIDDIFVICHYTVQ